MGNRNRSFQSQHIDNYNGGNYNNLRSFSGNFGNKTSNKSNGNFSSDGKRFSDFL